MNTGIEHKAPLIFFFFVWVATGYTQPRVQVKAYTDKQSILIGERLTFTVEADIPESQPIRFFSIDTIDHFEFLDKGQIDTVNTSSGTRLRQQFLLTSFDSGQWVIPAYVMDEVNQVQTDSLIIQVGFTAFDTSLPYHGIRDIIEVDAAPEEKFNWMIVAAAGLLLVVLAVYFFTRKKKPQPAAPVIDPYESAISQLQQLQKQELAAGEFYTRLTDIFRIYLAERRNISSLQKTTDELVVLLKPLAINDHLYRQLTRVLKLADFVKFARFIPAAEDDRNSLDIIKSTVTEIEKLTRDD